MVNRQRSTDNRQRTTDNGHRSHPDGSLLSVVYSLLTLFYQRDCTELFFLTEEQKGQKLCSFVLMSKVICLHVSRVSARIEVNGQRSTDNGQRSPSGW